MKLALGFIAGAALLAVPASAQLLGGSGLGGGLRGGLGGSLGGTMGGVGFARDPQVFMKPGDVAEVIIEGIGTLRNEIADERL